MRKISLEFYSTFFLRALTFSQALFTSSLILQYSTISVVAMTGATIAIDDAADDDTIVSVKRRVFAANRELPVRRQRLVYRPGPHGMEALADDETLGGAGVVRDGSAELDVLLAELTKEEMAALGEKVLGQRTECRSRREYASGICVGIAPIFLHAIYFPLDITVTPHEYNALSF